MGGKCKRGEGGEEEYVRCDQEGGKGGRRKRERRERKGKMQEKGICKGESLRLFSTHAIPYTTTVNHRCCDWLEAACASGTPLLIYLTLSLPTQGTNPVWTEMASFFQKSGNGCIFFCKS